MYLSYHGCYESFSDHGLMWYEFEHENYWICSMRLSVKLNILSEYVFNPPLLAFCFKRPGLSYYAVLLTHRREVLQRWYAVGQLQGAPAINHSVLGEVSITSEALDFSLWACRGCGLTSWANACKPGKRINKQTFNWWLGSEAKTNRRSSGKGGIQQHRQAWHWSRQIQPIRCIR